MCILYINLYNTSLTNTLNHLVRPASMKIKIKMRTYWTWSWANIFSLLLFFSLIFGNAPSCCMLSRANICVYSIVHSSVYLTVHHYILLFHYTKKTIPIEFANTLFMRYVNKCGNNASSQLENLLHIFLLFVSFMFYKYYTKRANKQLKRMKKTVRTKH